MRSRPAQRKPPPIEGINITPLTDMALTLLVLFIVVATFLSTEVGIQLQLPTSRTADVESLGGIRVTIGPRGEVYVNGVQVPWERLGRALTEASGGNTAQPVVLQVDRRAPYEYFFRAVDIARLVGLSQFTMASEVPPFEEEGGKEHEVSPHLPTSAGH